MSEVYVKSLNFVMFLLLLTRAAAITRQVQLTHPHRSRFEDSFIYPHKHLFMNKFHVRLHAVLHCHEIFTHSNYFQWEFYLRTFLLLST